jgi:hypothetical protein
MFYMYCYSITLFNDKNIINLTSLCFLFLCFSICIVISFSLFNVIIIMYRIKRLYQIQYNNIVTIRSKKYAIAKLVTIDYTASTSIFSVATSYLFMHSSCNALIKFNNVKNLKTQNKI